MKQNLIFLILFGVVPLLSGCADSILGGEAFRSSELREPTNTSNDGTDSTDDSNGTDDTGNNDVTDNDDDNDDADDTGNTPPGDDTQALEWRINETLVFEAGSGKSIDLKATLPQGVKPNGTFSVDNSGSPLPNGMTLSPNGILSLGNATVGNVSGVIFQYTEP